MNQPKQRTLCRAVGLDFTGVVNFGLCCREFWWRQMWRARSEWSATCRAAQVRLTTNRKEVQRAPTQVVSVEGSISWSRPLRHIWQRMCLSGRTETLLWTFQGSAVVKMKLRMFSSELEDLKSVDARRRLSSSFKWEETNEISLQFCWDGKLLVRFHISAKLKTNRETHRQSNTQLSLRLMMS